jgi:acyl transferase domain-containing protein
MRDRAFRDAYGDACEQMQSRTGFSLDEEAFAEEGPSAFRRRFLREAAAQLAMIRALEKHGHGFEASAGISLGEIAAATAAGALSFEDSIRVACVMAEAVVAATGGDLIVVEADMDTLHLATGNLPGHSVIEWPSSTVLAVADIHMKEFSKRCREAGIDAAPLGIRCMPHTNDVRIEHFRQSLGNLKPSYPTIPYYSCVIGGPVTGRVDGDFWIAMMSRGVKFSSMYNALHRDGFARYVHVGSVSLERQAFGHLAVKERPEVVRGSRLLSRPASLFR